MTGKIFKHAFALGAIVLVLCAIMFFGVQYAQTKEETYSALRQEAVYASSGVMLDGIEYLESLDDLNRITWIDPKGNVLYDSVYGTSISNQKEYTEVSDAFSTGEGHGIRNSVSGREQTMYYAVMCEDGSVLRLSRPFFAMKDAFTAVAPILWIFILVLLISGILAYYAAKQLVKPINAIRIDAPDASRIYPELTPLVEKISDQNLTIREQMDELAGRQREFAALTENMNEGFVLTDKHGVVLIANKGAAHLIGQCEVGYDLSNCENAEVAEAVKKALEGKRTDQVISKEKISVQLIVNPVLSLGRVTGAVVLLVDVTELKQREKLRREFSANVSHELKTPLTSISGFAELMMQDMVSPDKVKEFASDIYRESGRLIELVEDIIKLSNLDESDGSVVMTDVDITSLVEDAVDSLKYSAENKGVTIRFHSEKYMVRGIEQYVDEIIYNLCDNAVKYNKPGGTVDIDLTSADGRVILTVADTGIGIPYEHQKRVFERFYRVNKSRTRDVAGTGLGLSIVKHAAQNCGADISLESEPDKGTTICVSFEKSA